MKLIDNWRAELNRLWSIRLALLAGLLANAPDLLGALPDALSNLQDLMAPQTYRWLSTAATLAAFAARFIQQKPAA